MARAALIVEDDAEIARLVQRHLLDVQCQADIARRGSDALALAAARSYDLVILDLMLPDVDGLTLCQRLRAQDHYLPILMLTAKTTERDRVVGLERGADDYLTKPFSFPELLARVKALWRRVDALRAQPANADTAPLVRGELTIDRDGHAVTLAGKPLELTAKEFDLLVHFAQHPGRVFTRAQLLDRVWGYGYQGYEHTVNSHINRLRAKLERDPAQPRFILTVWGVGYKFTDQL